MAALRAQLDFEEAAQRRALSIAAGEGEAPAAKTSTPGPSEDGDGVWARQRALSNAACVQQHAGKQHLAAISLDKALQLTQGAPLL